jgi:hypothetical protein
VGRGASEEEGHVLMAGEEIKRIGGRCER